MNVIQKDQKKKNDESKFGFQGNYKLGTVLLSLVQQTCYMAKQYTSVIAQVWNHQRKGPIVFYWKKIFETINNCNLVYDIIQKECGRNFQDNAALLLMISKVPIYLVYPF